MYLPFGVKLGTHLQFFSFNQWVEWKKGGGRQISASTGMLMQRISPDEKLYSDMGPSSTRMQDFQYVCQTAVHRPKIIWFSRDQVTAV